MCVRVCEVPHTASVKVCHNCMGAGVNRCWRCMGRGRVSMCVRSPIPPLLKSVTTVWGLG